MAPRSRPKPPARRAAAATVTPEIFLASLPPERAAELHRVREVVRKHLPAGYQEVVRSNMIVYEVPLDVYPDTYNRQALWYAALAAPKNYLTLHLMPVYGSPELLKQLRAGFEQAGKRLDIGKACIRFRRADDLALDAIGAVVGALSMSRWVEMAKAVRRR